MFYKKNKIINLLSSAFYIVQISYFFIAYVKLAKTSAMNEKKANDSSA